jgi:hypothetical protein
LSRTETACFGTPFFFTACDAQTARGLPSAGTGSKARFVGELVVKRNQKILAVLTSLIAASAMLWAQAGPVEPVSPGVAAYEGLPVQSHLAQGGGATPLAVRYFPPER